MLAERGFRNDLEAEPVFKLRGEADGVGNFGR